MTSTALPSEPIATTSGVPSAPPRPPSIAGSALLESRLLVSATRRWATTLLQRG